MRSGAVADVGSGTGIVSALLLAAGYDVVAVEPNAAMRSAAEQRLAGRTGFRSIGAAAEETGLPDASVDLVTCAQAFHWFDLQAARREFARILRATKPVALVWNDRDSAASPFMRAYEAALQSQGPEYTRAHHRNVTDNTADRIATFFGGHLVNRTFANHQTLDQEALLGRTFSSSYTPAEGTPERAEMARVMLRLFEQHQSNGVVDMLYTTRLYVGWVK